MDLKLEEYKSPLKINILYIIIIYGLWSRFKKKNKHTFSTCSHTTFQHLLNYSYI